MTFKVCVEGNIGSGKSTALAALGTLRPDLAIFPEPVEAWGEMLDKFYDDPRAWALPFSLQVLLSFVAPAKAAETTGVVVERSPLSCRHVFSQLLFNEGKMAQEEWALFKEYCDVLGWTPDVLVYVHTPPEECCRRIRERGRAAERCVDDQYVRRIDFQYETMLRYAEVPVVRVDGTKPPEAVAKAIAEVVDAAAAKAAGAAASKAAGAAAAKAAGATKARVTAAPARP